MARNPDGTFKSGDPETKETARKGGEASGGVRSSKAQQRHAANQQRGVDGQQDQQPRRDDHRH